MTQGLSNFLVVHPSPKKNPGSAPENYFKTVMSMATKEEENGLSTETRIIACAQALHWNSATGRNMKSEPSTPLKDKKKYS